MSSFALTNKPSDKLTRHEHSFHNDTITKFHLDIPYYDDEIAPTQNMNGSLSQALDTATASSNVSMSYDHNLVDKKFTHDSGNVSLAISKVRIACGWLLPH
jgi:hypothetical protein